MFGTHDVMRAHHMPVCSERMLCALAKQVMHPSHKTRFVKSEGYARQWQSRAWASNYSAHGCANTAWARKLAEQRVGNDSAQRRANTAWACKLAKQSVGNFSAQRRATTAWACQQVLL